MDHGKARNKFNILQKMFLLFHSSSVLDAHSITLVYIFSEHPSYTMDHGKSRNKFNILHIMFLLIMVNLHSYYAENIIILANIF